MSTLLRSFAATLSKHGKRRCVSSSQLDAWNLESIRDAFSAKRHYFVHGGNLLVLAAINQTDMLNLRVISVGASTLGIFYNLLQPTPLIAPACWGVFFISCHFYYIVRLLRERQEVLLSDEAQQVFEKAFQVHGFTKMQFSDLLQYTAATWRTFGRSEMIHKRGDPLEDLHYLCEGQVTMVSATGDWMRDILPGRSGWLGELFDPKRNRDEYWARQRYFPVSYQCTAERCRTLAIPRRALDDFLTSNAKLSEAATRSQVADLWGKTLSALRQNRLQAYRKMLEVAVSDGVIGTAERVVIEDWRARHKITEEEHAGFLEELGWTAEEFRRGARDRAGLRGLLMRWLSAKAIFSQVRRDPTTDKDLPDLEVNNGSLVPRGRSG
mmetsp:Transcript_17384/g.40723  ORF Transcript_17384/g.40723 Transcript_17384/m.40723 type:complete len:381 (+) Transcript_17384:58-1200(+)